MSTPSTSPDPSAPSPAAGEPAAPAATYPDAQVDGTATSPAPGAVDPATGQPVPAWTASSVPAEAAQEAPKNSLAWWAVVAGVAVIGILLFTGYAIASALALLVSIQALRQALAIKKSGYPKAVGMTRAIIGLVLSAAGALVYVDALINS